MIEMKSPSFAFNSHDVPGPNYRMWKWMQGYEGITATVLVDKILEVDAAARRSKGNRLLNIVINAHGSGGYVSIGGSGIIGLNNETASAFLRLRGKNLGTIWLVSCQAANGDYGKAFCQILARNSYCQVVASDEDQEVGVMGTWNLITWATFDRIDEYEGNVYVFRPNGGMRLIDPHNEEGLNTTDYE